jgi:hypothetical protein
MLGERSLILDSSTWTEERLPIHSAKSEQKFPDGFWDFFANYEISIKLRVGFGSIVGQVW